MKGRNIFSLTRLRLDLSKFNDMLRVKARPRLVNVLKSIVITIGMRVTPGRIRTAVLFSRTVSHLMVSQGPKGTCLYLKTAAVLLQQSLGGHKLRDPRLISKVAVSRGGGMPRIILAQHRQMIRSGDHNLAKFYLSMLNIYRNIEYPGTLGLASITSPDIGTHALDKLLVALIPRFVKLFVFSRFSQTKVLEMLRGYGQVMAPIFKSGPGTFKLTRTDVEEKFNFSTHPVVLLLTARAILADLSLAKALFAILGFTTNRQVRDSLLSIAKEKLTSGVKAKTLGRLSIKEESAGKVRVFAMVDAWTQWAMQPLHNTLFALLKGVPMDGTFEQMAPLFSSERWSGLWSLDLTAATDRLPIWLQVELLSFLVGNRDVALAWMKVLVSRGYYFSSLAYPEATGVYHYVIGQPMGALSSWAMLAFTHHFLVQCSYWLAGGKPTTLYQNYAVLGDDLVIGDYHVKVMYLKVCASLGVKVGIHKSLLSPKGLCLEFAKRTIWLGQDVSPVPLKEISAASETLPGFIEFTRKYKLDLPRALQAFGFGWRTLSWLNKPLGKLGSNVRMIILGLSIPVTAESAEEFFALGQPRLVRYTYEVLEIVRLFGITEVNRLRRQITKMKLAISMTNAVSWSGKSVGILKRLEVSSLSKSLAIHGLTDFNKARMQTFGLTNWESVWGVFFAWISSMWDSQKMKIYMECDRIEGLLPHPIDDVFLFYIRYIRALREWSLVNLAPFSVEKVLPSAKARGMPPLQIRLWRKWSAVIQGSQPLSSIKR